MRERPTKLIAGILSPLMIVFILFGMSCEKPGKPKSAAKTPTVIKTKTGVEMVLIPAGWFEMGSNRGKADESPVHKVWVDAFLMDRYEVTQEQYGKLVLGNPSHFKGPKRPMEQMSWANAALYCNARSRSEGLEPSYDEDTGECNFQANGYRLPTEAEWEYACRAGTNTDYFFGREARKLKDYAWYASNSFKKTQPVGQKKPNPWGLYDIYGNVAEWCNDIYNENYYKNSPEKNPRGPAEGDKYVLRGGAWDSSADACRSSYRMGEDPGFQDACFARDAIGFRCVRRVSQSISTQEAAKGNPSSKSGLRRRTGFIYHDIFLQHKTGTDHPERPQRLTAIVTRLREKELLSQLATPTPLPDSSEWLTTVHTPQYVQRVRKSCQEGAKYLDSVDTPISSESYKVAVAAVGGVLSAIDGVMEGKFRNAFCAIRPPGHHALKDKAMGFCLFNNVAIGARYIQRRYGLSKVLIVDWDVHHGNGTQAAFYDDPTVLYFSTHQYPFYPGSGSEEEKGIGKGFGYNINVPLPAGCEGRIISILEGGYNLDGLADSVEAHILVLQK